MISIDATGKIHVIFRSDCEQFLELAEDAVKRDLRTAIWFPIFPRRCPKKHSISREVKNWGKEIWFKCPNPEIRGASLGASPQGSGGCP